MPSHFWNAEKMDANLNGALEWKTLGSMDFMGFEKGCVWRIMRLNAK